MPPPAATVRRTTPSRAKPGAERPGQRLDGMRGETPIRSHEPDDPAGAVMQRPLARIDELHLAVAGSHDVQFIRIAEGREEFPGNGVRVAHSEPDSQRLVAGYHSLGGGDNFACTIVDSLPKKKFSGTNFRGETDVPRPPWFEPCIVSSS